MKLAVLSAGDRFFIGDANTGRGEDALIANFLRTSIKNYQNYLTSNYSACYKDHDHNIYFEDEEDAEVALNDLKSIFMQRNGVVTTGTVIDVKNTLDKLFSQSEVFIAGSAIEEVTSSVLKVLQDFKVEYTENRLDDSQYIKIFD